MFSDVKEAIIEFLSNNALWICIAISSAIIIVIVLIVWQIIANNKKNTAKIKEIDIFECLGGKENIKEVSYKGSRINLFLNDENKLNKETLKSFGVSSIIKMSDHFVLVSENAEELVNKLH